MPQEKCDERPARANIKWGLAATINALLATAAHWSASSIGAVTLARKQCSRAVAGCRRGHGWQTTARSPGILVEKDDLACTRGNQGCCGLPLDRLAAPSLAAIALVDPPGLGPKIGLVDRRNRESSVSFMQPASDQISPYLFHAIRIPADPPARSNGPTTSLS